MTAHEGLGLSQQLVHEDVREEPSLLLSFGEGLLGEVRDIGSRTGLKGTEHGKILLGVEVSKKRDPGQRDLFLLFIFHQSTVTAFARLRGLSGLIPLSTASS